MSVEQAHHKECPLLDVFYFEYMFNKKVRVMRYLASLIFPVTLFVSLSVGGMWTWAVVGIAFGVLPTMELFLKPDTHNLTTAQETDFWRQKLYPFIPALFVPIQWGCVLFFLYQMSHPTLAHPVEIAGATASLAVCCVTFGINVGHELGHRPNRWMQHLAKLCLMSTLYVHFFIEHNLGHHRHVATEKDPASARRDESVYAFLVRSVWGSFWSAWRIDPRQMAALLTIQTVIWAGLLAFASLQAFALAALAGIGGALLLEVVNYIEHYGLQRRKLPNGRYEKVLPVHSWNSDHPLGRAVLFELSRHSDHHANPRRPYAQLRSYPEAPQLPTGYPGMILLSLVPPLFFRVMDPLLDRWASEVNAGPESSYA